MLHVPQEEDESPHRRHNDPHHCNVLMVAASTLYLHQPKHLAYCCSAGSKGSNAVKEMLQCGKPGNIVLIESSNVHINTNKITNTAAATPESAEEDAAVVVVRPFQCTRSQLMILEVNAPFPKMDADCRHVVIITNLPNLPPAFLKDEVFLHTVDLHNLSHLTELPIDFLSGCTGLKTMELGMFTNVTTLQDNFLRGCTGLKEVNLAALEGVMNPQEDGFAATGFDALDADKILHPHAKPGALTKLPWGFLSDCTGLITIDLTPFPYLDTLPSKFLAGCTGLKSVKMPPLLHSLSCTPFGFLSNCTSLPQIDLSPLSNITRISEQFMINCSGLEDIDLGPFSQVKRIQEGFLFGCTGLKTIDLRPLTSLETLDGGLLEGCTGLRSSMTTIHLESLKRLKELPPNFLAGFVKLQSIDLSAFTQLHTIHSGFLSGCLGLKEVDMSTFVNLTELPGDFLTGCSGLQSVDLTPLSGVITMHGPFLKGCSGLTEIDLTSLSKVENAPPCGFLQDCTGLIKVDLSPLVHTKFFPAGFLEGCTGIVSIIPVRTKNNNKKGVASPAKPFACVIPPEDEKEFKRLCLGHPHEDDLRKPEPTTAPEKEEIYYFDDICCCM